jgi:hypothetical protein
LTGFVAIFLWHVTIHQNELEWISIPMFFDVIINNINSLLTIKSALKFVDQTFAAVFEQNFDSFDVE